MKRRREGLLAEADIVVLLGMPSPSNEYVINLPRNCMATATNEAAGNKRNYERRKRV